MRRNVDAPEVVWAALTLLTEKLGYSSRQELTEAVLTNFVNSYPGVMILAADEAFQKMDAAEAKKDFEYVRTIPKPSLEELKELWGEDITGLTDGVKEQIAQAKDEFIEKGQVAVHIEYPELPDL